MTEKLHLLLQEIHSLEKQVSEELHRVEEKMTYQLKGGKVSFSNEVLKVHRSLKVGIFRYILRSNILFILTSPIIYSMILPAFILNCFVTIYQTICFPIYRIQKVDRRKYIRLDRHKLAYLNGIEKLNCDFCAYFNGSLSYAKEVASRTEQYWCPIRHSVAVKDAHSRYFRFAGYGDADTYGSQLSKLRRELRDIESS